MSTTHPTTTIRCGDDWLFVGPLQDDNGNPLNLVGATMTWKLDTLDLTKNIITLTLGNGIEITDTTSSTVEYGPLAAQTVGITPGSYYDTLYVVLAGGAWSGTVIEGQINAAPQPA